MTILRALYALNQNSIQNRFLEGKDNHFAPSSPKEANIYEE